MIRKSTEAKNLKITVFINKLTFDIFILFGGRRIYRYIIDVHCKAFGFCLTKGKQIFFCLIKCLIKLMTNFMINLNVWINLIKMVFTLFLLILFYSYWSFLSFRYFVHFMFQLFGKWHLWHFNWWKWYFNTLNIISILRIFFLNSLLVALKTVLQNLMTATVQSLKYGVIQVQFRGIYIFV